MKLYLLSPLFHHRLYLFATLRRNLFDEIVNYRRLELWGEGFGFSDYKRWNKAISRKGLTKGGSAAAAIAVTITTDDPNWVWVIPQWETDYNDAFKDTTKDAK